MTKRTKRLCIAWGGVAVTSGMMGWFTAHNGSGEILHTSLGILSLGYVLVLQLAVLKTQHDL